MKQESVASASPTPPATLSDGDEKVTLLLEVLAALDEHITECGCSPFGGVVERVDAKPFRRWLDRRIATERAEQQPSVRAAPQSIGLGKS